MPSEILNSILRKDWFALLARRLTTPRGKDVNTSGFLGVLAAGNTDVLILREITFENDSEMER
jgi:hypothetical protein